MRCLAPISARSFIDFGLNYYFTLPYTIGFILDIRHTLRGIDIFLRSFIRVSFPL